MRFTLGSHFSFLETFLSQSKRTVPSDADAISLSEIPELTTSLSKERVRRSKELVSGMRPLLGNNSLAVKALFPSLDGENLLMPRERVPPRQRLARNLKVLAAKAGLSGAEIGKKAKVDQKTISNMMRAAFDPRLSVVEKVANVFGMTTWQILAYDVEAHPPDSSQVLRLLERYTNAEDDGRKAIMQVAEIASAKAD